MARLDDGLQQDHDSLPGLVLQTPYLGGHNLRLINNLYKVS
jgi:hypothetical protein